MVQIGLKMKRKGFLKLPEWQIADKKVRRGIKRLCLRKRRLMPPPAKNEHLSPLT